MSVLGTTLLRRPSVAASARPTGLASLDLQQLRAHRDRLAAEDDLVTYWTCLTQLRIDRLASLEVGPAPLTRVQLVRVLGDTGSGRRRHEIVGQVTTGGLPTLPNVVGMWADEVDPGDAPLVSLALSALEPAERQLLAYSSALHDLMDDSTRELIVRYRSDPTRAIDALPAA